jgi:hypothetical protein
MRLERVETIAERRHLEDGSGLRARGQNEARPRTGRQRGGGERQFQTIASCEHRSLRGKICAPPG